MYSELLIHSGIAPVNKVHEYIRYIEASAKINGYKKEKPSGNSGVKTAEEGSGGVYGTKMLIHDPSESKVAEKNTGGDVAYPSFTSVSALNGVDSSDGYHDVRNARVYDNTIDIEELVSTRKYLMRRQGFDTYLEDAAKRYLDHKQTHLKILGYRGNEKNEESSKKLQDYIFNGKSEPASETPANDNNQNALRGENKPVHYKHCAANSNGSRKYIKQSDRLIQRVVMLLENYFSLTPEINLEVTGVITAIAASASVRNNDVFGGDSQNQEYYNREVESGVFGEEECSSCRTLDRLISFDPNELLRETELGTLWNQWLEKLKKTSFQQFEKEKIVFAGVSKVKNMKNSKDNDTQMKQEDQTNDELVQTHADDGVEINVNTKESTHDDFEDNKIIILTKTDKSLSSEDKKIIEKINEQIKLISEYPRFSQTFEMSRELRQTIQEIPNKGVLAHNKQLLPPIYTALRSLVQTAEEMRPFVPNFNGRLRRARNALMGVVELEVDLAAELEDFGSYSSTRKSLSRHEMESGDSESGIDSDGGDPSSANNKATKVLRSPPQNVNMMELLENIVILQECILEIIACLQIRREAGEDTNSVL
ncbi:hypothetical protein AX774_g162 [Zancudomyces culisetae]|uniref:Uncharacterized protein n=1 Tax=Zancudomyces culisetae TaxID=1213189 RepID=A0A1R1PZ98_ZANCU|nr:hypothetical protein AX774_g162 [Zancudomyces culisetae]|eukprot:OMH86271.1 hypothetical protein AX774_g162 [Zancudomyces culisetae]